MLCFIAVFPRPAASACYNFTMRCIDRLEADTTQRSMQCANACEAGRHGTAIGRFECAMHVPCVNFSSHEIRVR